MQKKDLEEILQEEADKIETREFSEIWADIKDTITQPEKPKRFQWKKKFSLALAAVAVLVCVALTPVIINGLKPAPEQVYFIDGLESKTVTEQEMLNGLHQAQINHADLSEYVISGTKLYQTDDLQIKGSEFILMDDENNPTFFAGLKLYHKSVDLKLEEDKYDTSLKVNSADVKYKLLASGETYDYSIYANYNNVQYVIEYTGISDNLMDFLNEFFD